MNIDEDQYVMEAVKEKVSNISASAKAGMDKTKAIAEEKADKMKTRDPLQKEMAEEMKEEKIRQAELAKQQAYKESAIQKGEAHYSGAGHHTGLGLHHTGVGHPTGLGGHHTGVEHQTGLGEPTGGVTGLHRTDAPATGTHANPTGHGVGGLM